MTFNVKFLSIKSLITWGAAAITSMLLIFVCSVHLYSEITTYKQALKQDITVFADFVSLSVAPLLNAENGDNMARSLSALSAMEVIENVHIYQLLEPEGVVFFASHNKLGIAPVKGQFEQVEVLTQAQISPGIVEIMRPIIEQGNLLGYVYLRGSAVSVETLIDNAIYRTLAILFSCLIICFLLVQQLERRLTAPLHALINLVQRITRQRDFTSRAEHYGIKELDNLSSAFNGMLQRTQEHMEQQHKAESEQARLNASLEVKVYQRTTALKEANGELIQTLEQLHQFQRQMVQNEKMASLGDMVAGVAHEVNTPIGLGITASSMMLDRLRDMRSAFEGKGLKASMLSTFIVEGEENLNIIYHNLQRSVELISSFKQVAVDQSTETSRILLISGLMDDILMSMRPKLKKLKHQIKVSCPDTLMVECKSGPINQIMNNLIMNSIIHGFESIVSGEIRIDISLVDSHINIEFTDNGQGIPESLGKRIFDPFVTTKRGQGGSGLGMHLVYNLVTQALDGTISMASVEGQGVTFNISFPVKVIDSVSAKVAREAD
jgi:signal transduction histidine kinase